MDNVWGALAVLVLGLFLGLKGRRGGDKVRQQVDDNRGQEIKDRTAEKQEAAHREAEQENEIERAELDEHRATDTLDERVDVLLGDAARLRAEQDTAGDNGS